jgi:hypothetical protein
VVEAHGLSLNPIKFLWVLVLNMPSGTHTVLIRNTYTNHTQAFLKAHTMTTRQ